MTTIRIHETFQRTIQGEGYWTGAPCDFIRLYGCPVGCHWCDTGYADGGKSIVPEQKTIAELIAELQSDRVVISGGEPFFNPHLSRSIQEIIETGRRVHVETSGAKWQRIPIETWVTLSPKEHLNPRFPVDPQFWARADEIKIVIQDGTELKYYRERIEKTKCPLFLQPEWKTRDRTIPMVLNLLQSHPTARLSMQMHKYLGVA